MDTGDGKNHETGETAKNKIYSRLTRIARISLLYISMPFPRFLSFYGTF